MSFYRGSPGVSENFFVGQQNINGNPSDPPAAFNTWIIENPNGDIGDVAERFKVTMSYTRPGDLVLIKPGTWRFTSSVDIHPGITIRAFDTNDKPLLKRKTDSESGTKPAQIFLLTGGCDNVTIDSIVFDISMSANAKRTITLSGCVNTTIKNCSFINSGIFNDSWTYHTIYATDGQYLTIQDCYFSTCQIKMGAINRAWQYANIYRNTFVYSAQYGLSFVTADRDGLELKGLTVRGNTITGSVGGAFYVGLEPGTASFGNPLFVMMTKSVLTDILIEDNVLDGQWVAGDEGAAGPKGLNMRLAATSSNIVIKNNKFQQVGTPAGNSIGIYVSSRELDVPIVYCDRIYIFGNTASNVDRYGIDISAISGTSIYIYNNYLTQSRGIRVKNVGNTAEPTRKVLIGSNEVWEPASSDELTLEAVVKDATGIAVTSSFSGEIDVNETPPYTVTYTVESDIVIPS